MALDTYGGLKTSVAAWLARADLTATVPDFILLAHKQLMRDLRGHLRLQARNPSFALSGEYVQVPDDFLEVVSFRPNVNYAKAMTFAPNDTMNTTTASAGTPLEFSMVSGANIENFRFAPVPSASMTATLEYYTKLPFFQTDGDTNWILDDHPDLYLYGSLLQATAYLQGDQRLGVWAQAYSSSLDSVKSAGKRARWGGNGMAVRAA